MRSWTDRLVLSGLAILGGGLISFGTGKAIAHYTISGSPTLAATPLEDAPTPVYAEESRSDLAQLVEGTRAPSNQD